MFRPLLLRQQEVRITPQFRTEHARILGAHTAGKLDRRARKDARLQSGTELIEVLVRENEPDAIFSGLIEEMRNIFVEVVLRFIDIYERWFPFMRKKGSALHRRLCNERAVRGAQSNALVTAVLNGFRDVRRGYAGGTAQIRNGARDFEDAVVGARRQSERADRLARKLVRIRLGTAVFADFLDRQVGIRFSLACELQGARCRYTFAYGGARLAGLA